MIACRNCHFDSPQEMAFCQRCNYNLYPNSTYFLQYEDFAHPQDSDAMDLITGVEPLSSIISNAVESFQKLFERKKLFEDAISVSKNNFPELNNLILQYGEQLCLLVLPAVYIIPSSQINAFTFGGKQKPVIMINSALMRMMNVKEISVVLGHEMGHIKCNHQQLHTLAYVIANGLSFVSRLSLLSLPLQLTLKSAFRNAELTADRASLLIANNLKLVKRVHSKISSNSKLSKIPSSFKWARDVLELWNTHPFTDNRIKELEKFSDSKQFKDLLVKMALEKVMRCPFCHYRINNNVVFCPQCKKALE